MDKDVNWYVFGGIGLRKLERLEQKNLIKTGYYAPEDLPQLLNLHEIDAIGILSVWPETYSYTLTEAILNKIPVIVTDIGALGRRTRELGCGWVVPLQNADKEFVKKVKEIAADKTLLENRRKHFSDIELKSNTDMAAEYVEIYENEMMENAGAVYEEADYQMIFNGGDFSSENTGEYFSRTLNNAGTGNKSVRISLAAYREMENELNEIKTSLSYKIVKKMWGIKFPGKQFVKRIIYRSRHVGEGNR